MLTILTIQLLKANELLPTSPNSINTFILTIMLYQQFFKHPWSNMTLTQHP